MILQRGKQKIGIGSILLFLSLLMIALLGQTAPARAQGTSLDGLRGQSFGARTGEIQGTVYLNRGAGAASQVVVNIRSLSSGKILTILTDMSGHFDLPDMPPGSYEISAAQRGYGFASTVAQVSLFPTQVDLYLNSPASAPSGENPNVVSVHELKIPSRALDQYNRGLERMAKKDFSGSLAHFNKATAAYPDYYEAIYEIGVAELQLNQQDKASEAFQKAIDLSGGHYARAQFAYGLLLCNQGQSQEAERLIRRGLESDSDSAEGHLFLGIALLNQNRLDEAEKSLREALLRNPRCADVFLVLGDVHAKRRDYQAQVQDLDAYLKLAPSSPGNAYVHRVRDVARRLSSEAVPQN